jgi:DNA repair protein NreA
LTINEIEWVKREYLQRGLRWSIEEDEEIRYRISGVSRLLARLVISYLLVPTRWSISATDDIISTSLIKKIQTFPTIDFFKVYKHIHLGNYYSVILIPDDVWSFEMQEAWFDNKGNLGLGIDFENANGLDHYPSIAGAYFAAKLGIAEHLFKRRHKAAALILREIHPEYVMPIGVWQIRAGIRKALEGEGDQFDNFQRALSFACVNLSVSESEWIRNSKIYKNMSEQMRITDFSKSQF